MERIEGLIMTTTELISYAALMAWVRSHRSAIETEAQEEAANGAVKHIAIDVQAADVIHEHLNTAKTEAALRGAVLRYREATE